MKGSPFYNWRYAGYQLHLQSHYSCFCSSLYDRLYTDRLKKVSRTCRKVLRGCTVTFKFGHSLKCKKKKKPISLCREEISPKLAAAQDFVLCTSGYLGSDSGQSDGTGRKEGDYGRNCPKLLPRARHTWERRVAAQSALPASSRVTSISAYFTLVDAVASVTLSQRS